MTSPTDGSLQPTLMGVMAADDPRPRVFRQSFGGTDVWPDPEAAGTGVCALQGKWSVDWGDPMSDILRMEALDAREMCLEGDDQTGGQRRHSIVHAFAIPHHDLPLGEIEVFDAQP
jgi:hypothetical protein